MALRTETVDFEAEIERLEEQMAEVAEEQAGTPDDSERAQQLLQRGAQLDRFAGILRDLSDGHIDTVEAFDSVELSALSAGDVNRVEDLTERAEAFRERDAWVAVGTVDAPYVEHDGRALSDGEYVAMDDCADTVTRIVSDLPLPYVRWAEEKISELSHLSSDAGNGYLELVQEKRQEKNSETNG